MSKKSPKKLVTAEVTTITSGFQTTVPAFVRKALGVKKGDGLLFSIDPAGDMIVTGVKKPDNTSLAIG